MRADMTRIESCSVKQYFRVRMNKHAHNNEVYLEISDLSYAVVVAD